MLIRLIQRKFANGDKERLHVLSQQIRQTDNTEILDQWFDQIFDAHVLHELEFLESIQEPDGSGNSEAVVEDNEIELP